MCNAEYGMRNWECEPEKRKCSAPLPHSVFRIPHSEGFTLLEVMVAVAILAMVLVGLLGVKNKSTQDVMIADHITTATLLAKRKMTEMLVTAGTGTIMQQEDEGEFPEEAYKGYAWKTSIAPTEMEKSLKEIRVAVLWKEGERQESVELVSYE